MLDVSVSVSVPHEPTVAIKQVSKDSSFTTTQKGVILSAVVVVGVMLFVKYGQAK